MPRALFSEGSFNCRQVKLFVMRNGCYGLKFGCMFRSIIYPDVSVGCGDDWFTKNFTNTTFRAAPCSAIFSRPADNNQSAVFLPSSILF